MLSAREEKHIMQGPWRLEFAVLGQPAMNWRWGELGGGLSVERHGGTRR